MIVSSIVVHIPPSLILTSFTEETSSLLGFFIVLPASLAMLLTPSKSTFSGVSPSTGPKEPSGCFPYTGPSATTSCSTPSIKYLEEAIILSRSVTSVWRVTSLPPPAAAAFANNSAAFFVSRAKATTSLPSESIRLTTSLPVFPVAPNTPTAFCTRIFSAAMPRDDRVEPVSPPSPFSWALARKTARPPRIAVPAAAAAAWTFASEKSISEGETRGVVRELSSRRRNTGANSLWNRLAFAKPLIRALCCNESAAIGLVAEVTEDDRSTILAARPSIK
mmetsp:Transcript_5969/g.7272  ORF Transcript_5969/g.7272 Transcript_5969/m.7272 type:complete len:277 (-) Transcript_5969:152-982(-)